MKKDYQVILDSLQMTGIYVIREDNHQILYYNRRVKEVAPNIELGMVCHEVWAGTCANCPLLHIGDKQEAKSVNYDDPFGKAVDIAATRVMWEQRIPAFVVAVTPHAETANYTYDRILKGNLTANTYEVVKAGRGQREGLHRSADCFSNWVEGLVEGGSIFSEDAKRFQKFARLEHLREELKKGKDILTCTYRRKSGEGFRWHTIEIVPDTEYSHENQQVMIYVKDVHDIYREGLEREEKNIKNQEIIKSLGEMNFGVYVIDLPTGIFHPVRTAEDMKEIVNSGVVLWEGLLKKASLQYLEPEEEEGICRKCSIENLRREAESGREKMEVICQRRFGEEIRYVSATAHFYRNDNGGSYVVLAFLDIDGRVRKEISRSQNERRMAAIIESRYRVMTTIDLQTGACEKAYLKKGSSETLYEGDYDTYLHETLLPDVFEADKENYLNVLLLENMRKKAEEVEDFHEEICRYRIMGQKFFWIEDHVIYLRQGNHVMVNILSSDITRRMVKEEKMMTAAREKASIINTLSSMYFAIYYVDFTTRTFRMVAQREEVGEVLGDRMGYTEGITAYAENFIHPEDREEYLRVTDFQYVIDNLRPDHSVISTEYRSIPEEGDTKQGEVSWIRAAIVLAETENGMPKTALYVAQDVTEVKQKEERERQALKEAYDAANYANASKSEFLSRMSHDIRTPLNAIIGMTAIAGTHLEEPERVEDCLNKITISGRHLLSLINEVLDMSKIESGKIDLVEEEFNLSDLVQNLITMMRPSILTKRHKLETHIARVEHEDVIGDVLRLQQVFVNILSNAVKYTPSGGVLGLDISEKPSKVYGYGCYEFVFRDNGIGMSGDFMKRIFEPFSREEDSRISKIEGTGLGMTIAQNIVSMMNGTINVESRLNEGSRFTVTVFLKLQEKDRSEHCQFADLPVLVVDDDECACESTCVVLDELGMKSEHVFNGEDAVERVWKADQEGYQFFAIILDWKMPDMDGIETARAIRKRVGEKVPIVILSAYDWTDVEEEARQAGVDGFISKPLFKSRLVYLFKQLTEEEKEKEGLGEEAAPAVDFTGKRILLVEDNELNREIAQEIIGSTGVTVETACDGKEAVDQFLEHEEGYYDLIFMDIQMPVMNGYDATRAIRGAQRQDGARIPIIAMTANAFAEDVLSSRKAGMNEHITKPLNVEELMQCMRNYCSGRP